MVFDKGEASAKDINDIVTRLSHSNADELADTYNELKKEYEGIWSNDRVQGALDTLGISDSFIKGEITEQDLSNIKKVQNPPEPHLYTEKPAQSPRIGLLFVYKHFIYMQPLTFINTEKERKDDQHEITTR